MTEADALRYAETMKEYSTPEEIDAFLAVFRFSDRTSAQAERDCQDQDELMERIRLLEESRSRLEAVRDRLDPGSYTLALEGLQRESGELRAECRGLAERMKQQVAADDAEIERLRAER